MVRFTLVFAAFASLALSGCGGGNCIESPACTMDTECQTFCAAEVCPAGVSFAGCIGDPPNQDCVCMCSGSPTVEELCSDD